VSAGVLCATEEGVPVYVALAGDPGIGKTTVANLVAEHPAVKQAFKRRISVAGVGQSPSIRAAFTTMWKELTGGRGREPEWLTDSSEDPKAARRELMKHLEPSQRTLLLLDDVWSPEAVQLLNICTADPHKMLVTSRDRDILARNVGNTQYAVEECRLFGQSELRLSDDHAIRILCSHAKVPCHQDVSQVEVGKELIDAVRKKCNNNPLALHVRLHVLTTCCNRMPLRPYVSSFLIAPLSFNHIQQPLDPTSTLLVATVPQLVC
jgi:hypothetical protein